MQVQDYGLVLEELRNENARHNGFPLPSPSREDRAGNRSSVSSEGFCENEVFHQQKDHKRLTNHKDRRY